jgi:hypothetical protein
LQPDTPFPPRRSQYEKRPREPKYGRWWQLLPAVLSILYVAAVIGLPTAANLELCAVAARGICSLLPTTKLTEFDKWGSYLSGALVPLSLIWVAMAFRLQRRQLLEQATQQARATEIAYESQRVADRQTLSALAHTYLVRMDEALRDMAKLINSDLSPANGRIPDDQIALSTASVANVYMNYHNILIAYSRGELNSEEAHSLKALFVDSDMSDFLEFFFEPFNEFHAHCKELDCLILLPPRVQSMASQIKWNFLRSTWKWHPDQNERQRLARLVGWTDQELSERFTEWPDDETWEPYDVEEGRRRLDADRQPPGAGIGRAGTD